MDNNISNRLEVLVKKTYYIYQRFQMPATFALLYHEEPLSVIELSKYVRISDQFMPLDDNHYFIIFEFTAEKNAYKASQNIIYKLDNHFNADKGTLIALNTLDIHKSPQNILSRLNQIIAQMRKDCCSRVETEDILER